MKYKARISLKPYLSTKSLIPENQETPIQFLKQWITPDEYFYRRNHFSYPEISEKAFRIEICGKVNKNINFALSELKTMPWKTIILPIECSGNKRAYFEPKVFGDQWKEGAITQGLWRGVPLNYLLEKAGLKDSAFEIVFEGYDYGKRKDLDGVFDYARSLPLSKALHPDTIVAYEYNGREIPFKHGYPIRLIVPGWYGMASVKWLKKITIIDYKFTGPFQAIDYVYYPNTESDAYKKAVTLMNVNSIIREPLDMSILNEGTHIIHGIAYTGSGIITEVKVSTNGGESFNKVNIERLPNQPYAWVNWYYNWQVRQKGEYEIKVRAKDSHGRVQPEEESWNRKGYGYNKVTSIKVKIE